MHGENKRKDILINKCHEFASLTACSVFLKIVDNECKKSQIYATDDIYYEFTTTGIQPTRNEKRCHPSKETNALKEVPPFNGEMTPKPSPLKVRKETNVKVNAILPGQLKSLPNFTRRPARQLGTQHLSPKRPGDRFDWRGWHKWNSWLTFTGHWWTIC